MPALKNARWERFVQALAKGETTDAAYALAGYAPNRGNATRLKANEAVLGRLAEIQEKAAVRAEITAADIAKQLDEDREFARKVGSAAASVAATMGKAKVLGLIIDKGENTDTSTVTVQYVTAKAGPPPKTSDEDYETPA